jgi:hypothetical protein
LPSSSDDLLEKLTRLGYLGPDGLKDARRRAAFEGIPVLEAALLDDRLHPDARGWILAEALGMPFSELEPEAVPTGLSELIPEALARENQIVPISRDAGRLTIGVADPFQHRTFSSIAEMTGLTLRLVVCPRRTIGEILARLPDPGTSPRGSFRRRTPGRSGEWISSRRVVQQVFFTAPTEMSDEDVSCRAGGRHRGPRKEKPVRSSVRLCWKRCST